jgi:hypothetical protein
MSDEPLTNAAVEFMRTGLPFMNVAERDEINSPVTDDFVFDDRRSGFNYGLIDASSYTEMIQSAWEVGSGRPTFSMLEVIAVRGQRIAAVTFTVDYGNDMHTDMISCIRFDSQLQLQQRRVVFDIDARDAAIAEVDRMHAEIEAGDA